MNSGNLRRSISPPDTLVHTNAKTQSGAGRGRTRVIRFISHSAAAFLLGWPAGALVAAPDAAPAKSVSLTDSQFILSATQSGMTGVMLGELAAQSGTRQDVKEFGKLMLTDLFRINDDLKVLAMRKNVKPAELLDAKHQAELDRISGLSGAEFDRAYIDTMIKCEKAVVKEYKSEARTTLDADIKGFLTKSSPVEERHLRRVLEMKK